LCILPDYKEYASSHYTGLWTAPAISMLSSAMVRAYCHKVIKLSACLQTYAPEKESVSNVHGVRADFLTEGLRRAEHAKLQDGGDTLVDPEHGADTRVYYIGKLLWAKGLDIMLELEDYYKQCTNKYFAIDIYGSGPDQKDITKAFHGRRKVGEEASTGGGAAGTANGSSRMSIMRTALSLGGGTADADASSSTEPTASADESASANNGNGDDEGSDESSTYVIAKQRLEKIKKTINAVEIPKTFSELRRQPIPATFPGRVDHGTLTEQYSVFINPSLSEVLCTTTAEALAMGKFAIIPLHPSNTFFLQFPNCLAYRTKFEFVANLRWALTHEPAPLTPELARQFSWEAATDRFIDASAVTWGQAYERERLGLSKLDERIAWLHNEVGKGATGDMIRKVFGAGPASGQVQYVSTKKEGAVPVSAEEGSEEGQGTDGEEDEDDGLSAKFRRSAFADALRSTIGDFSSFLQ
jgi:digalactosyldiacylglycerol synthase